MLRSRPKFYGMGGAPPWQVADMGMVNRVLDRHVVGTLDEYSDLDGGRALDLARRVGAEAICDLVAASGLRGRGGAGFPTGLKWQTVAASRSAVEPTTVVVNAAEGEPGTFKDRALLRTNPYRILEGPAIAALAVGAERVRIGIKATFEREVQRLGDAIAEVSAAGWFDGLDVGLVLGPSSYLFGEETGLLEVIEGRQPFPRVTPPFRRGVEEGGESDSRSAAGVELATVGGGGEAPALVDNVETLANVPLIVTNGPEWYRELGTDRSPGTIVCTITGATRREGVAELAMGTTLREAIELIGWGPAERRRVGTVVSGTSNALIPASLLDTPLTYEAMRDAGTGLGSAGFIVFDDRTDPVAIARGISRFLAVESCGQCEPCKRDGLALADLLAAAQSSMLTERELAEVERRVQTVSDGARCNLARQQEAVVGSLLRLYDEVVVGHVLVGDAAAAPPAADAIPIVPIVELSGGRAILDGDQLDKQPDWSYGDVDSGTSPADLLIDTPVRIDEPVRGRRWVSWSASPDGSRVHPLDLVDEAHALLDRLLFEALAAEPEAREAAIGKLGHITRVHVDVTRRILYPMARRHGGDRAEALAGAAEEREDLLLALAHLLEDVEVDDAERVATLRAFGQELRRHCEDDEEMLDTLRATMSDEDQVELAEGLVDARATSQVA